MRTRTRREADKRRAPRHYTSQPAMLVRDDGSPITACVMADVSKGGARLKFNRQVDLPAEFTLLLSQHQGAVKRTCILTWASEKEAGIRFPDHD